MPSTYNYVRRTLRDDLWVAGKRLVTGGAELSFREAGGSTSLMRMLAGNTVFQRRIGERFAPMSLDPWQDVELQMLAIAEEDRDYLQEVQGQDVPMFFELAHTDRFYITAELHTDWVLSRQLPWLVGSPGDFPVVVKISDRDDRSTFDALALAASSPPGAGEFWYAGVPGEQAVETADITAEADRILTVTYSPIRRMVIEEIDYTAAGADRHGALDVSVRMSEHLPTQAW
jgi:hypothetical protein